VISFATHAYCSASKPYSCRLDAKVKSKQFVAPPETFQSRRKISIFELICQYMAMASTLRAVLIRMKCDMPQPGVEQEGGPEETWSPWTRSENNQEMP